MTEHGVYVHVRVDAAEATRALRRALARLRQLGGATITGNNLRGVVLASQLTARGRGARWAAWGPMLHGFDAGGRALAVARVTRRQWGEL
jgi:hypothetical protein